MSHCRIDSLPEELLLHAFEYLDLPSPSERKSRDEPSLQLTESTEHPLKDVSQVSKRWRRIVLPLLFKAARLKLDVPWRKEWSSCPACGNTFEGLGPPTSFEPYGIDRYHTDTMRAFRQRRPSQGKVLNTAQLEKSRTTTSTTRERPDEGSTALWAARFYHALRDFLVFIRTEGLSLSIRNFVLISEQMMERRFILSADDREWRYPAAAALWRHLLSVVDPDRIVILAPPTERMCLAGAAPVGASDLTDWSFDETDLQTFELRQAVPRSTLLSEPVNYADIRTSYSPAKDGFVSSSILSLRRWTHAAINDGSFLKAYGTYEFFETGVPRDAASLSRYLALECRKPSLQSLRSFTYTGIFPFASHVRYIMVMAQLECIEEIDVQLAPDPRSSILDEKARTGKAELQDCWHQLLSAYAVFASRISTSKINERNFPRLKKFTCRDYRTAALVEELDEIFTPLCLPVWVERAPGHFTREAMSAQLPGIQGQ